MDTLVVICDHEGRFIQRKTGFPQRPVVSLSEERRMISAQFSHSIQLWKIGTSIYQVTSVTLLATEKAKGKKTGTTLSIDESCQLLLEMNLKCQTNLIRTALSPNGNLIATSDAKAVSF